MNKWLVVLLIFSLAVNLAAVGTMIYFTQRQGPPGIDPSSPPGLPWFRAEGAPPIDQDGRRPGPGMRKAPNPAVEKLRIAHHEKLQPLVDELQKARQTLLRLVESSPANRDSIDVVLHRVSTLQNEMEKLTVEHLIALRPLMDEEQWRNLTHMLQNRMRSGRPMRPNPAE